MGSLLRLSTRPSRKSTQPSRKSTQPSRKSTQPIRPSRKLIQPSRKSIQPSGKSIQPSGKSNQHLRQSIQPVKKSLILHRNSMHLCKSSGPPSTQLTLSTQKAFHLLRKQTLSMKSTPPTSDLALPTMTKHCSPRQSRYLWCLFMRRLGVRKPLPPVNLSMRLFTER